MYTFILISVIHSTQFYRFFQFLFLFLGHILQGTILFADSSNLHSFHIIVVLRGLASNFFHKKAFLCKKIPHEFFTVYQDKALILIC